MATLPAEFADLASELISDEFSSFASNALIVKTTGFTHSTQTATTIEQTVPMIRLEFKDFRIDGDSIQGGDYMLIGEYVKFTTVPTPENTKVTHDGITSTLHDVKIDPAKATIILHLRRA